MKNTYKIVYEEGKGEIIEKKSRFIAHIYPVGDIEAAEQIKERIKKEYWDARHNCTAYIIGRNNEIQRYDDDGEPQGTAGKPMLEILLNSDLRNCIVVVTRYFGGVLLGTGGLVRAYQASVKEGLDKAGIMQVFEGYKFNVKTDYTGLGKIQYISAAENAYIIETEYTDNVKLTIVLEADNYDAFTKKLIEATNGKVVIEDAEKVEYGIREKQCVLL